MSKVAITVPITIHRPGPNYETTTDRVGDIEFITGNRDVIVAPPGEPFEIDEEEGRALIARFGGKIVKAPT